MKGRFESEWVFFLLLCVVPLLPFLAFFDFVTKRRLMRCHIEHFRLDQCSKEKCFKSCCGIQEEIYLTELKEKVRAGDKEAQKELEFYYRYE